jgi:transcriptional regulator GlxA family with amidase domain
MIDVTIVLLESSLPSTSMAPLEIFACAGMLWGMIMGTSTDPFFHVRTATIDGKLASNRYIPVGLEPSVALSDVRRTDVVVVPSAGFDVEAARVQNPGLIEWLARRGRGKTKIAGICTGVSLLAAAGLLDSRRATTHWGVVEQCRRIYPAVHWEPERFVTEDDNVLCGGGVYASIDLSLYLVERFCGHEIAVQTAKALLLETPRIWQATYAAQPPRSAHDDEPVRRAQKWLFAHFREDVQVDELAMRVGMSPRNFARRFKAATGEAPLAYLHRLRIDAARHYLESGRRSVQDISRAIGYEDVAFFRRLFQRHTGSSPRAYRARFGPRRAA